jgi:hypothetical protein
MKNSLNILLALIVYLFLLFTVVMAKDTGSISEVTDTKLLRLYEIAIDNSHTEVANPPKLLISTSAEYEAYYNSDNNIIVLYSNYNWTDRYKNVDLDNITSDDALTILSILSHEYGHAIQHTKGLEFDEVQAQTFASYALLKIGFAKQRLKDFYIATAESIKSFGNCDQSEIGHPDACGEELQNARNVDHVDTLLDKAVS